MSDSKTPLLGRLAVHYKLINAEQLTQALAEQGDPSQLGDYFMAQGWIQQKQLDRLLQIQRDMLIKHRASQAAQASAPEVEAPAAKPAAPPAAKPVVEKPVVERPQPVVEKPVVGRPKPVVEKPAPAAPAEDEVPAVARAAARAAASHVPEARRAKPQPLPSSDDPDEGAKAPPVARLRLAEKKPTPAPEPQAAPAPQAAAASQEAPAAVEVGAPPRPAGCEGKKQALHDLLGRAVEQRASDLHVHSGAPLRLRIDGELEVQDESPMDAAACEAMLVDSLDDTQWGTLSKHGQVDLAYEVEGIGRFRANVYRQQRGLDATYRTIPPEPPTLEGLGLPESLAKFTGYHQGMVLVTGPAGCGKSATMAALVDMVNGSREEHIITVEDPIEVLHRSKTCLVNQRQVGPHTETFARALRAALREDPDIIGIGELRDLETISLALTAAETGHFVLGTLHTSSAIRTINRLIGVFPPDQQGQIRTMVSESLRAVISQRLVRRADGNGRVAALEIMVVNKAVGNLVRENKTVQIGSILQTGAAQGMCLLDESLSRLVSDGTITQEEARRHCEDPRRFGGAES